MVSEINEAGSQSPKAFVSRLGGGGVEDVESLGRGVVAFPGFAAVN